MEEDSIAPALSGATLFPGRGAAEPDELAQEASLHDEEADVSDWPGGAQEPVEVCSDDDDDDGAGAGASRHLAVNEESEQDWWNQASAGDVDKSFGDDGGAADSATRLEQVAALLEAAEARAAAAPPEEAAEQARLAEEMAEQHAELERLIAEAEPEADQEAALQQQQAELDRLMGESLPEESLEGEPSLEEDSVQVVGEGGAGAALVDEAEVAVEIEDPGEASGGEQPASPSSPSFDAGGADEDEARGAVAPPPFVEALIREAEARHYAQAAAAGEEGADADEAAEAVDLSQVDASQEVASPDEEPPLKADEARGGAGPSQPGQVPAPEAEAAEAAEASDPARSSPRPAAAERNGSEDAMRGRYLELLEKAAQQRKALAATLAEIKELEVELGLGADTEAAEEGIDIRGLWDGGPAQKKLRTG